MAAHPKRFYKTVEIAAAGPHAAYIIMLDGTALKTPAGAEFLLPNRRFTEAIAGEWRSQVTQIVFQAMPFTRLAFTAIDRVRARRDAVIEQIVAYGKSDVICYRAGAPADLVARQAELWDPLLCWARDELGVGLETVVGVAFVEQPEASLEAIREHLAGAGDFTLAAIRAAAESCGSAIIALALAGGVFDADAAFKAAYLDELHQVKKWGDDAEAKARRAERATNLREIGYFLQLARESAN